MRLLPGTETHKITNSSNKLYGLLYVASFNLLLLHHLLQH
jgi:hypothetical protein